MTAPLCQFLAPRCAKPATGRCTLCQQLACPKHSAAEQFMTGLEKSGGKAANSEYELAVFIEKADLESKP